jgi:hypothetical protein
MPAETTVGLHVKHQLSLFDFNQNRNVPKILIGLLNFKFHENTFCGSRLVSCVRADGKTGRRADGQTDTLSPGMRTSLRTHFYDVSL